jgi:hypothetical protein
VQAKRAHLGPYGIPPQIIQKLVCIKLRRERAVVIHLARSLVAQLAQAGKVDIALRQHKQVHADLHAPQAPAASAHVTDKLFLH